jgi:hypothetical protein
MITKKSLRWRRIQLAHLVGMEMRLADTAHAQSATQNNLCFVASRSESGLYFTRKILNYFLSNSIWTVWMISEETPRMTWYNCAFIIRGSAIFRKIFEFAF